jgi:hypothetical protein
LKKDKKRAISFHRKSSSSTSSSFGHYQLKGGIPIAEIEGIVATAKGGRFEIKVFYKDHTNGDMETFVLKFLNEEKLTAWQAQFDRLLKKPSLTGRHRKTQSSDSLNAPAVPPRHEQRRFTSADHLAQQRQQSGPSSIRLMNQRSQSQEFSARTLQPVVENCGQVSHLSPLASPSTLGGASSHTGSSASSRRPSRKFSLEQAENKNTSPASKAIQSLDEAMSNLDFAIQQETLQQNDSLAMDMPPPAMPQRRQQYDVVSSLKLPPLPNRPAPAPPSTAVPSMPGELMKIKAHVDQDIFVLFAPVTISHGQLTERLRAKIMESKGPGVQFSKLRYEDSDGDYITMVGDDDVRVAMQLAKTRGKLTLFL